MNQANRYHFLESLRPIVDQISGLSDKDYSYLLSHLADFRDDLLAAKENLISPIKAFMNGPQRAIYDDAISFLREEEANFPELPADQVQPLRDLAASKSPYRGSALPLAKAAVTKLRGLLADLLKAERDQAIALLDTHEAKLKTLEGFGPWTRRARNRFLPPRIQHAMQSGMLASSLESVIGSSGSPTRITRAACSSCTVADAQG